MYRYRFFKHCNEWRCIERGHAKAEYITTAILEGVLGVIGGPEVIVVAEQPDGRKFHITIKNGFIDKVVFSEEGKPRPDPESEEYVYIKTSFNHQTEFFIKTGV